MQSVAVNSEKRRPSQLLPRQTVKTALWVTWQHARPFFKVKLLNFSARGQLHYL